jgi:hypothetical protein
MTEHKPTIHVEIQPGTPTSAQAAAWAQLWARLLSKGQKQATDNEAAASQGEGNGNEAVK